APEAAAASAPRRTNRTVLRPQPPPASPAVSAGGAPPARSPALARGLALVLMAGIFWLDAVAPLGVAVPALYVLPALLFMPAGQPWEPVVVAAGATLLTVAGAWLSPEGGSADIGAFNRPLEVLIVWIGAALVAEHR